MDAFAAHNTMSKQALDSDKVRNGLRDILLGPAQLYEALRSRADNNASARESTIQRRDVSEAIYYEEERRAPEHAQLVQVLSSATWRSVSESVGSSATIRGWSANNSARV